MVENADNKYDDGRSQSPAIEDRVDVTETEEEGDDKHDKKNLEQVVNSSECNNEELKDVS